MQVHMPDVTLQGPQDPTQPLLIFFFFRILKMITSMCFSVIDKRIAWLECRKLDILMF